jgi:hypothetical protein
LSANVVGYVNATVAGGGYGLLANPLKQPQNTIATVLRNVPPRTTIYVIDRATGLWSTTTKREEGLWSGTAADSEIPFGQGFFVKNQDINSLSITFVGEVFQGTVSVGFPAGFSLLGSAVPQAGKLAADLQLPARPGDQVWTYSTFKQNYMGPFTLRQSGKWTGVGGAEPVLGVGEGFWFKPDAAGIWTRNIHVKP